MLHSEKMDNLVTGCVKSCLFALVTASGSVLAANYSGTPACNDTTLQQGARLAIENGYAAGGAPANYAGPIVKFLPKLQEYSGGEADALKQDVSKTLGIKTTDGMRICRAELSHNSYLVVMVARNPRPPNDLGFFAVNIGFPGSNSGAEGWVRKYTH